MVTNAPLPEGADHARIDAAARQITARPGFRRLELLARAVLDAEVALALAAQAVDASDVLDEDQPTPEHVTLAARTAEHTAALAARDKLAADLVRAHILTTNDAYIADVDQAHLVAELLERARRAGSGPTLQVRPKPRELTEPREPPATNLTFRRVDRHEHNLIARALLKGKVLPDAPDIEPEDLAGPTQPKGHRATERMIDVHRAWTRTMRDVTRVLEHLQPDAMTPEAARAALDAAVTRVRDARRLEAAFKAAARAVAKDRKVEHHTGRYIDGETFYVHLPVSDDPDAERLQFLFDLIILWADNGVDLVVANARELEVLSGVDVGEEGWRDLVDWLEWARGPREGRQPDDDRQLVWRDNGQSLVLRDHVRRLYPALPRALEALRATLRVASGDPRALILRQLATANTQGSPRPATPRTRLPASDAQEVD